MPTLDLTDGDIRILMAGLGELPMKVSFPVAQKVRSQLIEQQQSNGAAPVDDETQSENIEL